MAQLVARLVRDQEVMGSNPIVPTRIVEISPIFLPEKSKMKWRIFYMKPALDENETYKKP